MKKRIIAWILLAGFVILFVNLVFIRYQAVLSLLIYLVIVVWFLFSNTKNKGIKNE